MEIRSSKTKLFLIELIIIILFFSIAAAVCMNIFAGAKTMSRESSEQSQAMFRVQEAADIIKSGNISLLEETMGASNADGAYRVYYDSEWNIVADKDKSEFLMEIKTHTQNGMMTGDVSVTKEGAPVYSLEVKRYLGEEQV